MQLWLSSVPGLPTYQHTANSQCTNKLCPTPGPTLTRQQLLQVTSRSYPRLSHAAYYLPSHIVQLRPSTHWTTQGARPHSSQDLPNTPAPAAPIPAFFSTEASFRTHRLSPGSLMCWSTFTRKRRLQSCGCCCCSHSHLDMGASINTPRESTVQHLPARPPLPHRSLLCKHGALCFHVALCL